MNEIPSEMKPDQRPRLSLEEKIMALVRRYRAAEKRRGRRKAVGANQHLRMAVLRALPGRRRGGVGKPGVGVAVRKIVAPPRVNHYWRVVRACAENLPSREQTRSFYNKISRVYDLLSKILTRHLHASTCMYP